MRRDDGAAGEESMKIELEWQGHRLSMNSLEKADPSGKQRFRHLSSSSATS
jgi:hypothetical protein